MPKLRNGLVIACSFFISLQCLAVEDKNHPAITDVVRPPHVRGELLVKIDQNYIEKLQHLEGNIGVKSAHTFTLVPGLRLYQFDPSRDVGEVIRSFEGNNGVVYAEPNYLYHTQDEGDGSVNDTEFGKQWSLENTAQTGGKVDADINAALMWSYQKGSKHIVIGTIDTGIDYTHADLVDNLWVNQNEIKGNGIDDDHNGYIDDVYGANAIKNTGNPLDDNMHGTHVAGTIGAVGNNNLGVVGVNQVAQIAACKFLSAGGSGSASDAIKCMDYFVALKTRATNPVNIVATNNSWGGGGSSQSMLDAIKAHERLGILFFAAAGNDSSNNDSTDSYPANYDVANVVAVAATDANDKLASFSNFGKRKVHVAAPGVKILSTVLNQKYAELSGTSMATPHVVGLAAIIAAQFPNLDYHGIKNLIMTGGQKIDAAANTTISGRRIRGADVGGVGSITCVNQELVVRKAPAASVNRIELGKAIFLSAEHINCANLGGPLTVWQGEQGMVVLDDKGQNGDVTANDGVYSVIFQPTAAGTYELRFSDSDTVTVNVVNKAAADYIASDVPYDYISIGGTRLHAGDDTISAVQAPFPIQFGGDQNGFLNLYVSSNGTISFTDMNDPGYVNLSLPTDVASTLVAAFWDDLTTVGADSDIYYETTGASPSRKFIVEWWKVTHYRASGLGAFQVVFYENSPDVSINYLDTNFSNTTFDNGASATVGVQTNVDSAVEYSYNNPQITSGKSILFSLQ